MDNWRELAESLVNQSIAPQGISNPQILAAMKEVPRHLFVPPEQRSYSYLDIPLAIGEQQTISQPYIVAKMTDLLQVKAGDKVLEIGTGSGYQAALLAQMGVRVTTIERIERLALRARAVFEQLAYSITSIIRDGREGYPENAPYQGIIVTAGAQKIEESWFAQLADQGRLVMPLACREGLYSLYVRQKDAQAAKGYRESWSDYCRFVPILPGVEKAKGD